MTGYRIGAVANLTGIPTDTIRAWERRFHVVNPQRHENKSRYYSDEQITRLTKLKRLVDAGQAISTVAKLTESELDQRLAKVQPVLNLTTSGCKHLLVVSERMSDWLQRCLAEIGIEEFTEVPSSDSLRSAYKQQRPDPVLFNIPSLTELRARETGAVVNQLRLRGAVVIYRYASNRDLKLLAESGVTLIRGPVEPAAFIKLVLTTPPAGSEQSVARVYDNAIRDSCGGSTSRMNCECSRHLTELITALNAFEDYSSECQQLSEADRTIHKRLGVLTSKARMKMEQALQELQTFEQISQ